MGFSFKEDCPDIRNTKVYDVYRELMEYPINVDVFDPWVDAIEAHRLYGIQLRNEQSLEEYDAAIVAVGHAEFKTMGYEGIKKYLKDSHLIYDLKHILERSEAVIRL